MCFYPLSLAAMISPSQPNLSLVAPEAMLRDLTEYITKTGEFADARGGFGEIWKCIFQVDQGSINVWINVAVKSFSVYASEVAGTTKKKSKKIHRELKTCARLEHPNILPVHGYTTGFGPLIAIVSPWAENGNLNVYLEKEGDLPVIRRFQILRDIAAGLRYLHANDVIHGDLTGANVLIHGDGTACIADFGLSLLSSELTSISQVSSTFTIYGNVRWLAPELIALPEDDSHVRPNKCSDVYSFGGVILQVLTSKIPYYYYQRDANIIWFKCSGKKTDRSRYPTLSSKYWDLIDACRSVVPDDRPSVERVAEEIRNVLESLSSSSATS
ncbi:kinase-like protein [Rhizopogon salebrosus TDB-379]|nr:kinase-like protein [Rhizopogon salebrosus TDB-379]